MVMDRAKSKVELERLIAETRRIAPSVARFEEQRNYGTVTDENLDIPSFLRWELESGAALQQLAESGAPVFTKLHAQYLDQKEASKKFHSRSILAHRIMQLLVSASQLLDSPWSEPGPEQPASNSAAEMAGEACGLTAEQSTPRPAAELSWPEKVTIAWAVRHVPLSTWLYLAGIIGSVFIAGATIGQLPSVRPLIPGSREDRVVQPSVTPTHVDARIRLLTEAHTQRVAKITDGIVAQERAAGFSALPGSHIEAARRLREMLREENESYQKALAQLKAFGVDAK